MNPNDESLLSAFLDDELEPAERARVAAALRSDDRLAVRLRELSEVREVIAGLPRLASPDVVEAVMVRIAADVEERRRPLLRRRPARVLAFGLGLGATAALWLTMIYVGAAGRPGADGPVVVQNDPPAPPDDPPPPVTASVDPAPVAAPPPTIAEVVPVAEPVFSDAERSRSDALVRRLLERDDVYRVDLELGPAGADELETVLARSPLVEPDFGRIELLAERATVFALTADGLELGVLLRRLAEEFGPAAIAAEAPADRELAHRVADQGPFRVATAIRAEVLGDRSTEVIASKGLTDPGIAREEPVASPRPGTPEPSRTGRFEGRRVVLLWVAPGGPDVRPE